ncbi:unnamed protein product [Ilex paraguariensis]|uniref:Uncharacterized protein n=1 Tax=Ilex paraguariensis TaxID=185542 RepID=A0ABC8V479_9AQUA
MPQVDLETLVSVYGGGNSDSKITCETLADSSDNLPEYQEVPDAVADVPPDFPPESFWLSKDAEFDWFDRNAFYERKESTKGNSNSTNLNPNVHPGSNSNSQRFSLNLKSKASIIGLPKTQKASYVDVKRRNCKPPNIKLFPKRSESLGKSAATEPSSPKVSCMGRVRSKRGRRRSSGSVKKKEKAVEKSRIGEDKRKTGFYSRLIAMFKAGKHRKTAVRTGFERKEQTMESPARKSLTVKHRDNSVSAEPVAEPPGLGGMMRFASGRRSESWSVEEVDVANTDSLDLERRVGNRTSGPTGRS